jgi:hypothetical protein
MRRGGLLLHMEEMRTACTAMVGKPLERLWRRCENNIKMNIKKIKYESVIYSCDSG